MQILEQIKNKTNISVEDMIIKRLCRELKTTDTEQLLFDLLDVIIIILDNTNLRKVPKEMYATVINMTKDYWYLNHHDMLCMTDEEKKQEKQMKVKSITVGDTTTSFVDKQSQININGTTYNTGTVEFDKNILVEKYKKDFYRYRQLRWN